eukprot:XP_024465452.1 uncharacterized protein LOC18102587 isoform X2 [Populus trichocarpa]
MLFPLIQVHLCSNGNLHDSLRMYRAWIWWWYGPMWGRGVMVFCLKRSKSYGQSMKTMLPWRPTLSKTLTKFEFLNDAIKEQVEMILRALEYEMEQGKVLDEFFFSAAGKFRTAIGKSWAAEISSRRNSILARKQN